MSDHRDLALADAAHDWVRDQERIVALETHVESLTGDNLTLREMTSRLLAQCHEHLKTLKTKGRTIADLRKENQRLREEHRQLQPRLADEEDATTDSHDSTRQPWH